jgi:hypothetical protein
VEELLVDLFLTLNTPITWTTMLAYQIFVVLYYTALGYAPTKRWNNVPPVSVQGRVVVFILFLPFLIALLVLAGIL